MIHTSRTSAEYDLNGCENRVSDICQGIGSITQISESLEDTIMRDDLFDAVEFMAARIVASLAPIHSEEYSAKNEIEAFRSSSISTSLWLERPSRDLRGLSSSSLGRSCCVELLGSSEIFLFSLFASLFRGWLSVR